MKKHLNNIIQNNIIITCIKLNYVIVVKKRKKNFLSQYFVAIMKEKLLSTMASANLDSHIMAFQGCETTIF